MLQLKVQYLFIPIFSSGDIQRLYLSWEKCKNQFKCSMSSECLVHFAAEKDTKKHRSSPSSQDTTIVLGHFAHTRGKIKPLLSLKHMLIFRETAQALGSTWSHLCQGLGWAESSCKPRDQLLSPVFWERRYTLTVPGLALNSQQVSLMLALFHVSFICT